MKPKAKIENCRALWRILSDGKWHKSKDIPMNHRMIRACCEAKPEHFLSGQKGYKLVRYASDAELQHAIADLRSRVKHLNARADSLERAAYTRKQAIISA